LALAAAPQQAPSFRSGAQLVVVPTVVTDRRGAFLSGLEASAFHVFEDGRPVPIEVFLPPDDFGAGADGRFLVLVLDNLRTRAELGERVKSIARRFHALMRPSDQVSVITLSGGRASTGQSPEEVRVAIDRFRPAIGDPIGSEAEDAAHGLRTIASLTARLAQVRHRRKVLVFIGAGAMFSPQDTSAFSDRETELSPLWFDAVAGAGRDNVSVYVIDPEGVTGSVDDYSDGFAALTGGAAWVHTNNFDRAVNQIWRESGSYYLLGYAAPGDGRRLHRIEVEVDVPNATVRSRRARG
jgi:VWFA-related protein